MDKRLKVLSDNFSKVGEARSKSRSLDVRSRQYVNFNVLRFFSTGAVFIRFRGFGSSSNLSDECICVLEIVNVCNLGQCSTIARTLMIV